MARQEGRSSLLSVDSNFPMGLSGNFRPWFFTAEVTISSSHLISIALQDKGNFHYTVHYPSLFAILQFILVSVAAPKLNQIKATSPATS